MSKRVLGVLGVLSVLAIVTAASVASAGFAKIDDFESYVAGSNLNGQGNWTASTVTGAGTVVDDPLSPGNNVAQVSRIPYSDKGAHAALGALSIPEGGVGTVFFRATRVTAIGFSIGFADNAFPTTLDGGEVNINIRHMGNSCKDGGTNRTYDNGSMGTNVWVNYWLVADNGTDTWRIYQLGNDVPVQTLLIDGAITDFNFATATTNPLTHFGWMVNQWGPNPDTLYVDDVYVDPTGLNLSDPLYVPAPVPEPAGLSLLGLALLGLRRRRS